jgi:hypothetical protein
LNSIEEPTPENPVEMSFVPIQPCPGLKEIVEAVVKKAGVEVPSREMQVY